MEPVVTVRVCCGSPPEVHCSNATGVVTAAGIWRAFVETKCPCGEPLTVDAWCEGNPACAAPQLATTVPCPGDPCCLTPTVGISVGPCNTDGTRTVTFNVSVTVTSSTCLPYDFSLAFGDGNYGPPMPVTATGVTTFPSVTHNYASTTTTSYTATFSDPFHPNCPAVNIPVSLVSCVTDCCPTFLGTTVTFGACNSNCERQVTVTTNFAPYVPPCPPATLQWVFTDKNGQLIANGTAINTALASPHIDTFWASAAQSPITGTLTVSYPLHCTAPPITIIVPSCVSAPPCPSITSFSYTDQGCVTQAGACCRQIGFAVDANVSVGCGSGAVGPKLHVDFGDGTSQDIQFNSSGSVAWTFSHIYCTGGNYNVVLSVVYPPGCASKPLTASVPVCAPQDCNLTPTPPPACPCCLWWTIAFVLFFMGLSTIWANDQITIFGVTLGVVATWSSLLFALLMFVILFLCYMVYCATCFWCYFAKCTVWACIIAAIAVIILFIIGVISGSSIVNPWALFGVLGTLLGIFLISLNVLNSPKCQNFFATGNCN
jgi:hypothetical protein